MQLTRFALAGIIALLPAVAVARPRASSAKPVKPKPVAQANNARAYTPDEARRAVALLDDAYSLILHEVHDTYPTKPGRPVAATIVRDLQKTMTDRGWPSSHFLAVNAIIMNPAHQARDEWERRAVSDMKSGKLRLEEEKPNEYRATTMVSLRGGCTSCHWSQDSMGARAAIAWKVPLTRETASTESRSKTD